MAATETATLGQLLAWLNGMAGWSFDFSRALEKCRIAIVADTKRNFADGHSPEGVTWPQLRFKRPGSKGADKPLRKHGLLAASLAARGAQGNVDQRTPTRLEWGTNLQQAALQQHGGKVEPKASKYLAIPQTVVAERAGSPRNMQGLRYEWARGPKLRGKLVEDVVKKRRKKTLIETITHYLLVTDVTIPPRPFLGWNDDLVEECGQILAEGAAKAVVEVPVNGGGPRMVA